MPGKSLQAAAARWVVSPAQAGVSESAAATAPLRKDLCAGGGVKGESDASNKEPQL